MKMLAKNKNCKIIILAGLNLAPDSFKPWPACHAYTPHAAFVNAQIKGCLARYSAEDRDKGLQAPRW